MMPDLHLKQTAPRVPKEKKRGEIGPGRSGNYGSCQLGCINSELHTSVAYFGSEKRGWAQKLNGDMGAFG